MKIKKIMVALLITSFMLTQSLQVNAYNNMNYSIQSKQLETLEGVEITKLNWNSSDWATGLEFPEIDKYSQDNKINNYALSIDTVIVNNHQYKKDMNDKNENYVFEISVYGLRIKPGAFIDGENVVVIKASGYKDKEIIFNKNGNLYTLVSQKNISEDNVLNYDKLDEKITEAKNISQGDKNDAAFDKLKQAISAAETIRYSATSQQEIDSALEELITAIDEFNNSDIDISDNLKDGVYTLNFTAKQDGKDEVSMLQGVFDEKVKLVVTNGKMKLSMLNISLAPFLLDFSIESNGIYPKAEIIKKGEPELDGTYNLQEFVMDIKNLEVTHKGAVLVTMMGGQITDIGNYEKYTKLDITFDKKIIAGWTGYQYEIDSQQQPEGNELLTSVLVKKGYDTNNDQKISKEELQQIEGYLDLSNCKLDDISMLKDLSSKVTTLDISANNIKSLPDNLLDNMTGLINFYAQANKIDTIPVNFFDNNSKLEWISLSSNNIKKISNNIFNGVTALKELSLENNKITEIEENAFEGLTNLEALSLSSNGLDNINEKILSDVPNLTMLFLDNNNLTSVPDGVEKLILLNQLYLDKNNISEIKKSSFTTLADLKTISLKSNEIKMIEDGAFSNNTKLESLYLYDNNLTEFKITYLPENISLNILDIQLNYIDFISEEVKALLTTNKFNPQKIDSKITLENDNNTLLKWSQNFSALDLLYWYDSTTSAIVDEITSKKDYLEFIKNSGYDGWEITDILNEEGYDWDIEVILQCKDINGEYQNVDSILESDSNEMMKGQFNIKKSGTYRIVKNIYCSTYGNKEYKFSVISNDLFVEKNTTTESKFTQDGTYSVEVDLWNASKDQPSMAADAIDKIATVIVKDGIATMYVTTKEMTLGTIKASLQELYIGSINGDYKSNPATIVNKDSNGNPNMWSFTLPNEDELIDVVVNPHVAIMGNSDIAARLKVDYSTLKFISESTDNPEVPQTDDSSKTDVNTPPVTSNDNVTATTDKIAISSVKTGDKKNLELFGLMILIPIGVIKLLKNRNLLKS